MSDAGRSAFKRVRASSELGERPMGPAWGVAAGAAGFTASIAAAFLGGIAATVALESGLNVGPVGMGLGATAGALVPFVLARLAGASNFAAGAIVGVVTIVIAFGGCLVQYV